MKESNSKEKHFENITMNEILVAFSQKYHGHFFKILEVLRKKERPVYFDARTKIHLKNYLNSRSDDNPALFVSLDKPYNRLQISGVEIRLRNLGKRLGINKVHPHKFRRTVATKAIDKGMPIEQVQNLLGHSQIDTTMHYAMVNQNNVKESHRKYVA